MSLEQAIIEHAAAIRELAAALTARHVGLNPALAANYGEAVAAGLATKTAEALPDDLQGVFLMVARAATLNAPAPSDATLARAYGSHSPRRARRLLAYFEEQGVAVVRTDFHGRRIVAFPEIGRETGPGDPDAQETPVGEAAE